MPRYKFITVSADDDRTDAVEGEFKDDHAAIADARQAFTDLMHDAAIERRPIEETIEVLNDYGAIIAVVSFEGRET